MSDSEKKYTPQEVAKLVLLKAQQMFEKSTLNKSEKLQATVSHSSGLHKVEYFNTTPFEKHQSDYGFEPFHKSEKLDKGTLQPAPSIALSEKMDKHGLSPAEIKAKMNKAGGSAAFPTSRIDTGFGKIIAKNDKNPDEKEDAQLGEDVEHLCEDHFKENADAERKEGHKLVAKSECVKCEKIRKNENIPTVSKDKGQGDTLRRTPAEAKWQMDKSENFSELYEILETLEKAESKHDRCVKDVEENSPDVKNPHAVCVAEGVKPAKWSKAEPLEKKYEGFKAVEESARESGAKNPAAVAAAVGRKKYGKKNFQEHAAEGKSMKHSHKKSEEMNKHGLSANQIKAKLNKYEDENKDKPSDSLHPRIKEEGIERDYHDFKEKPGKGKSSEDDHRQVDQESPLTNPSEMREGNNPEPGSTPGTNGRHKLQLFQDHIMAKRAMKKGICLG